MKAVNLKNNLPPVIRVFLSSTFSDMQNERDYFNSVLVPKLSRICAARGVSFFSVDLRWGITEEDQVNGQVLPICLEEIDKCRPFFIGMVGNRYGSVMETVAPQLAKMMPWLAGKEGTSITELEMLYAVLEREEADCANNCAFYLRSDELSDKWYGSIAEEPRLAGLKEKILAGNVPNREYNDLEMFGQQVTADIIRWLDENFPEPERIGDIRREWYNRELLRGYIENSEAHSFLNTYLKQSDRSLLFCGDSGRGKTTFLTAWQPPGGEKILINCGSDDTFLYWPSIARYIINQIREIDESCAAPDMRVSASVMFQLMQEAHNNKSAEQSRRLGTDFYFVTDEEREQFRVAFLQWLEKLQLQKPLCIIINDLNLLEDDSSRMLSWLPSTACGSVRFICSTNDEEMVSNAENLGWNCKKMTGFSHEAADTFLRSYLRTYGKKLSEEQLHKLLCSSVADYPGQLRLVARFLINNGQFENLDALIGDIASQEKLQDVYGYIYNFSTRFLTQGERRAASTVFALLRFAQLSLSEPECFRLTKAYTDVSAIEWARIRSVIEQFGLIKGDYWNMREEELQKFTDHLLPANELHSIEALLGDAMLRQLHETSPEQGSLQQIREGTAFAKATLHHYQHCQNWDKLRKALMDDAVLQYLSKLDWHTVRVAWVTLFLHSDIDIPESLFSLLRRYQNACGDDRQILLNVARLFVDLEQRALLPQVYELVGITRISGTVHGELDQIDPDFIPNYNKLNHLKSRRQFRQVFNEASDLLATEQNIGPIERCQLLFFKADAQIHLQQHQELLESSNAYYIEAIRASSIYDINRALTIRGNALYFLGQYSAAEAILRRVSRLSMRNGYLRAYLASENIFGMCLYKTKKYPASVECFDRLIKCWRKLNDGREVATSLMNKANALILSGENQTALQILKDELQQLPEDAQDLRAHFLGNMGKCAYLLKLYDEAENYLLQSISEAKTADLDVTAVRSYKTLVALYTETDRFLDAVEQYKMLLEMLWTGKKYGELVVQLRNVVDLLLVNKYGVMAKDLWSQWKERFLQIEGGKAFFERQAGESLHDSQHFAQLKEKLALAQSEGNASQIADVYYEMAWAGDTADIKQAIDQLLRAATLYSQCGQEADHKKCLGEALCMLFEKGIPKDKDLYAEVCKQMKDPALQRIAAIWERIGDQKADEKTHRHPKVLEKASVSELLQELVTYSGSNEKVVVQCLADIADQIIAQCDAEQIIGAVCGLPETSVQTVANVLDKQMLKDFSMDVDELTRDYLSQIAKDKLDYYEKCLKVLTAFQSGNAAAVAGNLAIIYRRRQDEEQTIRCHTISTQVYKNSGKIYDYLIEMMNTASAYNQFGRTEQAIATLRSGVKESAEAGQARLEASMAGNLASILSRTGDPAFHSEVLQYFAIEENYFRRLGTPRDLVISLLNQIIYQYKLPDNQQWLEKLEEAGSLIRANHFREYEKVLAQLEWAAKASQSAEKTETADSVEANIQKLLQTEGSYWLKEFSLEDGYYCAICNPKEPSKTMQEQICLRIDPKNPNQLNAICLCQAQVCTVEDTAVIQEYIAWSNSLNEYRLVLRKEDMFLQAVCRIQAADWDNVISQFSRFRKLWEVDQTCFGAMCIGLNDMPMFQGAKLIILNGGK